MTDVPVDFKLKRRRLIVFFVYGPLVYNKQVLNFQYNTSGLRGYLSKRKYSDSASAKDFKQFSAADPIQP